MIFPSRDRLASTASGTTTATMPTSPLPASNVLSPNATVIGYAMAASEPHATTAGIFRWEA